MPRRKRKHCAAYADGIQVEQIRLDNPHCQLETKVKRCKFINLRSQPQSAVNGKAIEIPHGHDDYNDNNDEIVLHWSRANRHEFPPIKLLPPW